MLSWRVHAEENHQFMASANEQDRAHDGCDLRNGTETILIDRTSSRVARRETQTYDTAKGGLI